MNSKEAAILLGIDPKALRKMVRDDLDNFGVKQIDGKWSFSKSDIARIRSHIEAQKNSLPKKNSSVNSSVEELSDLQKRILSRRDRRLNKEVTERHLRRIENLEARLRAAGIHLSQHRDDGGENTRR